MEATQEKINYHSVANQKILRKLVDREVIHCASMLVYELSRNAENFPDYTDELYRAYTGSIEYETAARDAGWQQAKNGVFYNDPGKNVEINTDADDWEELCYTENIDTSGYENEVYEHWIVTDWFADKLELYGEKILRDFFGFTIWCRCCTGQAILLDRVIGEIAEGLDILEGQLREWKD